MFRRRAKREKPGPKRDPVVQKKETAEVQADKGLDSFVSMLEEQGIDQREMAAQILAEGYTIEKTAKAVKVHERTIYNWKKDPDFLQLVDELTLTQGIATKAERVRQAKKILRELRKYLEDNDKAPSQKDPLDWMKFLRDEMEGFRLLDDDTIDKLAEIFAGNQSESIAGGGPGATEGEDRAEAGSEVLEG